MGLRGGTYFRLSDWRGRIAIRYLSENSFSGDGEGRCAIKKNPDKRLCDLSLMRSYIIGISYITALYSSIGIIFGKWAKTGTIPLQHSSSN